MAIKLVDELKAMGNFPIAHAEGINLVKTDGTEDNLQTLYNNGELSGGDTSQTLTESEFLALPEEERLNNSYYLYDIGVHYKNGVAYSRKKPIQLTMEEYKALGEVDPDQEYIVSVNTEGILLEASDIGYSNAVSNLPCTTVQGAIDKVVEKVDSEISSNLENCFLNTGIIISNESDIKSVDDAPIGICFVSKDAVDNPFTFWSTIFTVGYNNNKYEQQLAFPWAKNEAIMMKFRVKDNGVWNDWKTISLS